MRSRMLTLILLMLLLTACTRPTPPPAPPAPPETPPAPADSQPAAPAQAWRKVMDNGSANIIDSAPDGSGILLRDYNGTVTYVQNGTWATSEVPTRNLSFTVGDRPVTASIADTPYGPRLISSGNDRPMDMALSPDGKSLAVTHNGLWVVDLASGQARRAGSEPEPAPPNSIKHQVWTWATYPSWSADGQWIEFYSSRLSPGSLALWRVPAAGGKEELVSRKNGPYAGSVLPDGRVVEVHGSTLRLVPADGTKPTVVAEHLPGPWSYAPDGRWVMVAHRDEPRVTAYELPSGKARTIALPPGSWASTDAKWLGSLALITLRPVSYDGPAYLAVVDAARGTIALFAPPEPTRASVGSLGWTKDGKVLARILPLGAVPGAASGIWVLDPSAYRAPPGTTPTALQTAAVSGPPPAWRQDGVVPGGETAAQPSSIIWLQFDQPPDPAWVSRELKVEGPGTVETHGASLGIVSIRLAQAQSGDTVRVRLGAPAFDLTVKVAEQPTASLDIRRPDGAWEPVRPDLPPVVTGPVDLRIRFSSAVDQTRTLAEMRQNLPGQARWEDGALLLSGVTGPSAVRIALPWSLTDLRGVQFATKQLPPVYLGAPPQLVAVDGGKDLLVTTVPPEVTTVVPRNGALEISARVFGGEYPVARRQLLDLAALRWSDLPPYQSDPRTDGLREAAHHGNLVAGLEEGPWLGKEHGYRWESALVIRGAAGQEVRRITGLQSYWPVWFLGGYGYSEAPYARSLAWSPDGKQIALVLPVTRTEEVLLLADVASGALRTLTQNLRGGHLEWAPTGRHIVVGGQVFDTATGQQLTDLGAGVHHLRWAPDGTRLLFTREIWGSVFLADIATGTTSDLGKGLPAGFDGQGRPLLIRWEGSAGRYIDQGI